MKKNTFSPAQIAGILKEFDNGKSVEELTREHGVSRASLYKWRQRYGGMDASEMKRIKDIAVSRILSPTCFLGLLHILFSQRSLV